MTIIVISSKYLTNTSLQSRMFPMTAIMVLDESRQHNNSIDRLVHPHGNKQNPTSNIKEQPFKWQMLQCPLGIAQIWVRTAFKLPPFNCPPMSIFIRKGEWGACHLNFLLLLKDSDGWMDWQNMIMNEVRKTMALAQLLCDACDDKSHSRMWSRYHMSCNLPPFPPLKGHQWKGNTRSGCPRTRFYYKPSTD